MLEGWDPPSDDRVLVGLATGDDAGVYRLDSTRALVQTVDYITPVVDDPYRFGQIAAANALSDVYAMGGSPLTALNVLLYPACDLDPETVALILKGGADKVREAGACLVGGHTVDNPELVYGLAVTGWVDPERLWCNTRMQPGDALVLTKPLGLGLVATAAKAGMARPEDARRMAEVMAELNRWAAEAARGLPVHGATDVTGFGLAGHARNLARGSGLDVVFRWEALPLLPGAREALSLGLVPGGAYRNREAMGPALDVRAEAGEDAALVVCDPQTSGGLLLALPPAQARALVSRLGRHGNGWAAVVGEAVPGQGRVLVV